MADRPVIGVLGHFGNRNLGDEAIISAAIGQIRGRLRHAEILCFSLRPTDTAFRHGVETFPVHPSAQFHGPVAASGSEADDLPWQVRSKEVSGYSSSESMANWRQRIKRMPVVGSAAKVVRGFVQRTESIVRELGFAFNAARYLRRKRIDLLVIAGSNQFLDNFGGPWAFPFGLLRWTLLAKLAGSRVAFMSVGAGPLDSGLSKLFIRIAARLSDYLSYRDLPSKSMVESGWPRVSGEVIPDLAFGLACTRTTRRFDSRAVVVGINPMPVFDSRYWFEHDQRKYLSYVEALAEFSARLIRTGRCVFLFPTMWRDDDVIRDVEARLASGHDLRLDRDYSYRPNDQVPMLIDVIREADIVVATRFHASVLSFHLEIPVLGIGYYRKTEALMNQMKQGQYYVSIDSCDADALWDRFLVLEANMSLEREAITTKAAECRRSVGQQWDAVLKLVGYEGMRCNRDPVAAESRGR